MQYEEFLDRKLQIGAMHGFDPTFVPDYLFDFQRKLVEWAVQKGRAAIFADCGLGKSICELVWARNVQQHTNKPVLIVTPLAVSYQFVEEGEKFGIECSRCRDGRHDGGIVVTNYERLHHFNPEDFGGVVCDESSAIKNFDGKRKAVVTEFLRTRPYRLLATATAAPNDYFELGTSSEALGELGYMDMIGRFFKQETSKDYLGWGRTKYRFREHAKRPFWRWVCSWARACRKPSDLDCDDGPFSLPPLDIRETVLQCSRARQGMLFVVPAATLQEQRQERRETIEDRCQMVADKVVGDDAAVAWCHLNPEGDLLEKLIPDAVQISGRDSDDAKEEKFLAFSHGQARVLVIKPKIGAWGLNWQHCAYMTTFPSHSYEQWYQSVRRCWRFGQTRPVVVDIVTTEGEQAVVKNLQRKADQYEHMFSMLVEEMNNELRIARSSPFTDREVMPLWL